MPEDNGEGNGKGGRIVPGGELNLAGSGLDGIVVDVAPRPAAEGSAASSPTTGTNFGDYTLDGRLVRFLHNSVPSRSLGTESPDMDYTFDAIADPATLAMVTGLGADFFSLGNFEYTTIDRGRISLMVAKLKLADFIPMACFEKWMAASFGGQDAVKFFLSTDIARALGLDDSTKSVDLNDDSIQELVPEIAGLKRLSKDYVIPADPYILLLAVDSKYRRFLSACLDHAKNDENTPFDQTRPIDHTMPLEYGADSMSLYGIGRRRLNALVESGFLSLPTIVKTARKFGQTELKPYLDAVTGLKNKLNSANAFLP